MLPASRTRFTFLFFFLHVLRFRSQPQINYLLNHPYCVPEVVDNRRLVNVIMAGAIGRLRRAYKLKEVDVALHLKLAINVIVYRAITYINELLSWMSLVPES
jgi:hypothetical protein